MLNMKYVGKILSWYLAVLVITTGCRSAGAIPTSTSHPISPPLTPYQAKTNTPVPSATPIIKPTDQPLLPSPTPFKHIIQSGDTLYALALLYNISLDRLVSANPGIDTSILSVGIEINIPFGGEDDLAVPTPTPHPVLVGAPTCLLTNDGGMWCFAIINNSQELRLENISTALNLFDRENNLIQSYVAILPLNYLYPDQAIPVSAFIPPPLPEDYRVTATLLTSLPSEQLGPATRISNVEIIYMDNKNIADIEGSVRILENPSKEDQVWIAAVAYTNGNPVGIRKWISEGGLEPGIDIIFNLSIYSLGPAIDEIKLFSELH
ncbi:MAG: LysM peptidoglycan-binding domain-containing protein [Anaerolineales bacterium]|nr:LysM peptidoglycan-binding domain-containing protein [Anaerolineales bacterium]